MKQNRKALRVLQRSEQTAPDQREPLDAPMLLGSNQWPGLVQIGDEGVQLGTLVAGAHSFSGMTADDWNALSEEDRDGLLSAWIQHKRAEANGRSAAQPAEEVEQDEFGTDHPGRTQLHVELDASDPNPMATVEQAMREFAKEGQLARQGRGLTSPIGHIDEDTWTPRTHDGRQLISIRLDANDPNPTATMEAALKPYLDAEPEQPEPEELPVADNNDTPALPGGFSPTLEAALAAVVEYIPSMRPKMPVAVDLRHRQQINLYRALTAVINKGEGEEFTRAWTWLLEQFSLYRKGVFHDRFVYRDFDSVPLSQQDCRAFKHLLHLLICTCDPKSRPIALRQLDLNKTLQYGVTEPGRQRVLAFYGL